MLLLFPYIKILFYHSYQSVTTAFLSPPHVKTSSKKMGGRERDDKKPLVELPI